MSRFANPNATGHFVLPGPCVCPGQPHDEDYISLRTELGGIELVEFATAEGSDRLRILATDWNLLDDSGAIAPMDEDHFRRLYSEAFEPLNDWLTKNLKTSTLPNASGAPSRNGSRASASQAIRTIPKRR